MMASLDASELAHRLGRQAEAVCRHYLSNGRRQGNYWLVGDVRNAPGRSMFVRLRDGETARAGKWSDAATGEHGDLLDVIGARLGNGDFQAVVAEARHFLSLPEERRQSAMEARHSTRKSRRYNPRASALRLWRQSGPFAGSLAASYLQHRAIHGLDDVTSLRFLPNCRWYHNATGAAEYWPAMLAAVTDDHGTLMGVHRTWLTRDGLTKAPVDPPRKALGHLLGHAVRFGEAGPVMAAGEGIETVLSLRQICPQLPLLAALSAVHLAVIRFPPELQRLYILQDRDPAGANAVARLQARATEAGIEVRALLPRLRDFNDDLQTDGIDILRQRVRDQLHPQDVDLLATS